MTAVPAGARRAVDRSIRAGRGPTPMGIARVLDDEGVLGVDGRRLAVASLADRLVGLGPLAPLVADPEVCDVLVNGDGRVWVERGQGVEPTTLVIPADELRPLASRLAGLAGRRLDDAQPWVDGTLPGGVRLHAVLPPLAEGGPHLSLRIARRRPGGVAALEALGAVGPEVADVLRALVPGSGGVPRHGWDRSGEDDGPRRAARGVPAARADRRRRGRP
ncbi:hypothetical protein ACSDQ9_04325 [Aestuariimicrobium soli]|uniref:hypothetical protein n=1 Tax=Aestuariimicrobium soli TaxID=2035834 RepID=UPI003EBE2BF1